jgi:amylosucrase
LKEKDSSKEREGHWFLSNTLAGMSLYVDRFCGSIKNLEGKLDYLERLDINFLHLMPLFESPPTESDGRYAVSNFREIDRRFGTLEDLQSLQEEMRKRNIHLMLDIMLNHTSHRHEWAVKAKSGDPDYAEYFYFFEDRTVPDELEKTMPDIFRKVRREVLPMCPSAANG